MLTTFCVVLFLNYHFVSTFDSCATRLTCQDCIRDSNLCVWCAENDYNQTRCKAQDSFESDWCPGSKMLENPVNLATPTQNRNFSYDHDQVVQIKPQQYKMKLRPGKSVNFTFSFQSAQDFPVDLYFLIDASTTMSNITKMTAVQSENIYNTIKTMTKNVYLGLGTFVDKRVLPFTDSFNSEETYSFRHRLPLSDNFTSFKDMIFKIPSGINRDPQEGGLDALAQAMVCKSLIGWRNESRKIVIFLTDGPYHTAGDGRSAGLFHPYDGQCYTEKDVYTKELEMDYPSLGMINKLATERNMIVFFFVADEVEYIYRKLSGEISGSRLSTFVRHQNNPTTDDSIPRTLKDIYEKISKKVTLKVNIKSKNRKNVEITFNPHCVIDDSDDDCNVEVGKEKQFEGNVKILEYQGEDNMAVDIAVESIGEKLTLDIEIIKSCDCESDDRVEDKSAFCNGEKRICGECSCGDKSYGERCVCKKTKENDHNDTSTCILQGSSDICSGHGVCECGACRCRNGYDGKFCECNVLSCPLRDGMLCSGITHGKCHCGKCICQPGWKGEACECSTVNCMIDGKICNNRGHCKCGACVCDPLADWDKRNNQDESCRVTPCSNCHDRQCKILENCVKCLRKSKDVNADCNSCDNAIKTKVVQTLPKEYLNSTLWRVCSDLKVEVGCYSDFVYRYDDIDYTLELVAQRNENCAETYYLFGGIFLLAIVLIGVGTLVAWKLLTEARDRREYMQFKEKANEDGGATCNPLYAPPTTTFQNPGFRKRSYK